MENLLYGITMIIARIHGYIMQFNDQNEYYLSDKQLHFIIMGAVGMIMIFVLHPLFKWLAARGHVMVISFLYVFSAIIVIAFAIEIGQGVTGTGNMESADISAGIFGFLVMFAIFAVIRGIYHLIRNAIRKKKYNTGDQP